MALFSYDHNWIPGWSPHSFATFYTDNERQEVAEAFTLSWLPASSPNDVSLLSGVVPGKNYTLKETLDFAFSKKLKIRMSGHFKIKEALYQKARTRKKQLESGSVKYEVSSDVRVGKKLVLHCVHAISDIVTKDGLMDTGWSYAEEANEKIIEHFKKHLEKTNKVFPYHEFYSDKLKSVVSNERK